MMLNNAVKIEDFADRAHRLGRRLANEDRCPKCGSQLSFKTGGSYLLVYCIRLRCDHRKVWADIVRPPPVEREAKPRKTKPPPSEPDQPTMEPF